MQPRKVRLTLDVLTAQPLQALRDAGNYSRIGVDNPRNGLYETFEVLHVQAEVVATKKGRTP